MLGGRTLSRYDSSCCSNSSHDGMLTTRAGIFCRLSSSKASMQRATSLPVPIRITAGRLVLETDDDAPRFGDLIGVGGTERDESRNAAQSNELLDRLVRRSILAHADRVVR